MKHFLSCILALIVAATALCLASCGKSDDTSSKLEESNSASTSEQPSSTPETSESSESSDISDVSDNSENIQDDISDKRYIITTDFDFEFDIENNTLTVTESSPNAPLINKFVFEGDVIKVSSRFEDEDTENVYEFKYTETNGKLTKWETENESAEIEYDANDRISKVTYVETYDDAPETYTYTFTYTEEGAVTIASDKNSEMMVYGHEDFYGLTVGYEVISAVVENDELTVKLNHGGESDYVEEVSYDLKEVTEEEFKMYSIWGVIDYIDEIDGHFDREFVWHW